ncbi:MAG: DUF2306 domain-containing protein [Pseudomonadota bacterium]
MSSSPSKLRPARTTLNKRLQQSTTAWFIATAIGQLAFISFIIAFYYVSIFTGDFAHWNTKPLIKGYEAGDTSGNAVFAGHVILAAIMTLTGLLQLIPQIRSKAPHIHRISGRIFVTLACLLALSGLWLGWVRDTRLSWVSAYAVSLNGILILAFAVPTVWYAVKRKIAIHKRWAIRLFLAASGVWFLRIFLTAWLIIAGGPKGMNATMSGPVDMVITYGSYLIPLIIFEIYWRAKVFEKDWLKRVALTLMVSATLVTMIGIFGSISFLWGPYL